MLHHFAGTRGPNSFRLLLYHYVKFDAITVKFSKIFLKGSGVGNRNSLGGVVVTPLGTSDFHDAEKSHLASGYVIAIAKPARNRSRIASKGVWTGKRYFSIPPNAPSRQNRNQESKQKPRLCSFVSSPRKRGMRTYEFLRNSCSKTNKGRTIRVVRPLPYFVVPARRASRPSRSRGRLRRALTL